MTIDPKIITDRIRGGEEYLGALSQLRTHGWDWLLHEFLANRLAVPQAFVLLHPEAYDDDLVSLCGQRAFSRHIRQASTCEAEQYWGIPCRFEFDTLRDLCVDHIFPYSLGGPTIAQNALVLCRLHNSMKGNDVHLYPWERGFPNWFQSQIERIRKYRLTK